MCPQITDVYKGQLSAMGSRIDSYIEFLDYYKVNNSNINCNAHDYNKSQKKIKMIMLNLVAVRPPNLFEAVRPQTFFCNLLLRPKAEDKKILEGVSTFITNINSC